ncbi:hypothetical protein MXD62_19325 [Frankia sp. Mgl5]|uniref:hypothetical protein n=1 Tax=Frankia sp. Mgl5 TaxID=2933793 RepID=UPI00200D145C|nr:hypothetical protein [Frankia sp. Mgl5]MCK9929303.1 hypothetical protein [Frankia sp. Mgl5]
MTAPPPGPTGRDLGRRWTVAALIEDAAHAASTYKPGHMDVFIKDLESVPGMVEDFQKIFKVLARLAEEELPTNPGVSDLLTDVARVQGTVAKVAEEVPRGAKVKHRTDLERLERPRRNERLWNAP